MTSIRLQKDSRCQACLQGRAQLRLLACLCNVRMLASMDAEYAQFAMRACCDRWASAISAGVNEGGYERNTALFVFEVTITLTEAGLREAPGAERHTFFLHVDIDCAQCPARLHIQVPS